LSLSEVCWRSGEPIEGEREGESRSFRDRKGQVFPARDPERVTLEALKRRDKGLLRHEKIFLSGEERVFSRRQARGGRQNIKVQNPNDKWLMSYDKRTPARPLLAVIGPVFAFRGLLSSVSGLVYAVCGLPSSSQ